MIRRCVPGLSVFFLLATGLSAATAETADAAADPGALVWVDPSGYARSIEDYRGDPVVLNFWATWCRPCVQELPLLSKIQRRYAIDGVRVVGVSADDPARAEAVVEFAKKRNVEFPILLGATTTQMKALGLGEALPATAVLDRAGTVVARFRGIVEKGDLEPILERLVRGEAIEEAIEEARGQAEEHDLFEEHDHAAEHDHGDEHGAGDAHAHEDERDGPAKPQTEASLVPS